MFDKHLYNNKLDFFRFSSKLNSQISYHNIIILVSKKIRQLCSTVLSNHILIFFFQIKFIEHILVSKFIVVALLQCMMINLIHLIEI